jgi:phage-related protein
MLAAGLIQALPQLVASLPQIVAAIITGIGKAAVSIVEIGKNIIQGLWSGIASMLGWIQSKVNSMVSGIVRSMKGVLGIRSPSKVFAGIGENMGQGIGEGFTSAMKDVEKEMAGAIPHDFDLDMNSVVSGVESGSSGAVFDVTIPLTIDGNHINQSHCPAAVEPKYGHCQKPGSSRSLNNID